VSDGTTTLTQSLTRRHSLSRRKKQSNDCTLRSGLSGQKLPRSSTVAVGSRKPDMTNVTGDNAVKNYWNTTMQRKYRRSLSVGSNLSHSAPRRSSLSPFQTWQRITPQGALRNPSPPPARYHPYAHHPRTPPTTPDRPKTHVSPHQCLPPLTIPHYSAPYPTDKIPSAGHSAGKQLPDIHTVFASPSPSPNDLQLPPLQQSRTRSLSESGYCSAAVSSRSSPSPSVSEDLREQVRDKMRLESLLL